MKRYKNFGFAGIDERENGEWVKYEDIEPLIEALKQILIPFDCINCEMSSTVGKICDSHYEENRDIAREALKKAGVEV